MCVKTLWTLWRLSPANRPVRTKRARCAAVSHAGRSTPAACKPPPPHAARALNTALQQQPRRYVRGRERTSTCCCSSPSAARKQATQQGQNRMLRRVRAAMLGVLGAAPCGMQLAPRRPRLRDRGRVAPCWPQPGAPPISLTHSLSLSLSSMAAVTGRHCRRDSQTRIRTHPAPDRHSPHPTPHRPRRHCRVCSEPKIVRGFVRVTP
jgi:hypothetical protein